MVASVVIANSVIVFSDSMYRYPIILWILNITGSVASGLGLVAVYRHGLLGPHGKSYLFLTIGLISWLSADLTLTYYYYTLGIEEGKLISFADLFWISGYVFLALHLVITLKSLKNKINLGIIIVASCATLLLIAYDIINLTPSFFLTDEDLADLCPNYYLSYFGFVINNSICDNPCKLKARLSAGDSMVSLFIILIS